MPDVNASPQWTEFREPGRQMIALAMEQRRFQHLRRERRVAGWRAALQDSAAELSSALPKSAAVELLPTHPV